MYIQRQSYNLKNSHRPWIFSMLYWTLKKTIYLLSDVAIRSHSQRYSGNERRQTVYINYNMWWSRILTSCSALYLDSSSPIKHNLHRLHARWEHVIAAPQRCIDILCYVVMAITGETKYFEGDYMCHAFSFEWYNIVHQRCWVKRFRRLQCYSRELWDSVWCDISASTQAAAKPLCSALT